jgi:Mo-dependent nitrogenase C-terminus
MLGKGDRQITTKKQLNAYLGVSPHYNHLNSLNFGDSDIMSTYFLQSIRQWIDRLPINNQRLASQVCELIPAQCPFERDLTIFGHHLIHIPPLCKLNPLYAELAALRWRALCYLADQAEPKLN